MMQGTLTTPLLSVVIPTYKRPQLLLSAIDSALQAAPDRDVEVIVVPNGPDESWKTVAHSFDDHPRIRWHPIHAPNANAARNHGLSLARGKFIRFLDDDDYFLPGAIDQIEKAYNEKAEICSAPVDLVLANGCLLNTMQLPHHSDFVCGVLSPERKTGLQFHIYSSSAISGYRFNETISIGQDTHWTHSLCRARDWNWHITTSSACTWVQHSSSQISSRYGAVEHLKLQEQMLWDSIVQLNLSNRLNSCRKAIAAQGMWALIHNGFFLSPMYWYGILCKTRDFFPDTYPDLKIYQNQYGKVIPPEFIEILMLPKRWLNHSYRNFLIKTGDRNFWQH